MTDLRGDGAHNLSLSKAVPLLFTELPRALIPGSWAFGYSGVEPQ